MKVKKELQFILLLMTLIACKKETSKETSQNDNPSPLTENNGWTVAKHSLELFTYKNGTGVTNTLNLVKEHATGIDVLYSSTFQYQSEAKWYNTRWRIYNDNTQDVKRVIVTGLAILDYINRPILTKILDVYSNGMGENDMFVINEVQSNSGAGGALPEYNYEFLNAKTNQIVSKKVDFRFKSTQSESGIGSANPKNPFIVNGLNAWIPSNQNNIFNIYGTINQVGAAPKGSELVMVYAADTLIYIYESHKNTFIHNSGTYSEIVASSVVKNIINLSKITGSSSQNAVIKSAYFYDDKYLYVFLGLLNKRHRFLIIDLNNYSVSSVNESLYEQVDLDGNKNIILLENRPGDLLSMELDGIYLLANNSKKFIPSAQVKIGTSGTTVAYHNNKLWQVLFDNYGAYLINKKL